MIYRKNRSLGLKGSASAVANNLSVHVDMAKTTIHYAVVNRYMVNVVSSSMNGQTVNSRQVVCKEPSVNYCSSVIQVQINQSVQLFLIFGIVMIFFKWI